LIKPNNMHGWASSLAFAGYAQFDIDNHGEPQALNQRKERGLIQNSSGPPCTWPGNGHEPYPIVQNRSWDQRNGLTGHRETEFGNNITNHFLSSNLCVFLYVCWSNNCLLPTKKKIINSRVFLFGFGLRLDLKKKKFVLALN
jgi:hypothetical protein